MTTPRQPEDHPPPEEKPPVDPHAHAPRGIPPDADAAEPKGTPHSDRHNTETST